MDMIRELLASPVVAGALVTAAAAVFVWAVNRKEKWKDVYDRYKGAIFQSIRWAEKQIPDDAEQKWMRRADEALRLAVRFIEEVERRELSAAERKQVAQALEYGHAELTREGVLSRALPEAA